MSDTTVTGCRNCDVRPAVVAGLCAECAETAHYEMLEELQFTQAENAWRKAKLARVEAVIADIASYDMRWLPTVKERRWAKRLVDAIAADLRAALTDESEAADA